MIFRLETIVARVTSVSAVTVIVRKVTALQARDFLFATTNARLDVITLQIAANSPLVCMPLYQLASSCSLDLDYV